MKNEIQAASSWWTSQLPFLTKEQHDRFRQLLEKELEQRCQNHWYLSEPNRGSGYRVQAWSRVKHSSKRTRSTNASSRSHSIPLISSILFDVKMDNVLENALRGAGVDSNSVAKILPKAIMWVNPGSVRVRRLLAGDLVTVYDSTQRSVMTN
eukprot:GEZU01005612.1.p1 GENE.GEZU01005612.1~~GEZU01005612.1.p1  ORF type:complete len:152 (-),score=4.42 GEZU01005612.1:257-712(-)